MLPTALHQRFLVRHPSVWFILVPLLGTTLLHYLTSAHLIPYHSLYRSLYYLPLAVAAVRYGRRGGVLTAIVASVLYIPHILLSWSAMPSDAFNDLLETGIFLFFGGLVGSLADAERQQRQRAQEVAAQLAATNAELQVQVTLAERMRASISSILESIDSGVVTFDDQGQMTTCNRAAEVFLDWEQGEQPPLQDVVQAYVTTAGRGYRQLRVADRVLGVRGSPLIGAHGERIGTVVVLDDMTELRALEEQVQRAQRLAALGRLAGGLAHEIRNPLGITRAAAQLLQRALSDHETLGEYTHVIQTEIDRVEATFLNAYV